MQSFFCGLLSKFRIKCESSSGVEHHLAKVRVAGSNPVFRSKNHYSSGGIGRHAGLKIQWTAMSVWVQVPSRVLNPRRNGRVVECTGLENQRGSHLRGVRIPLSPHKPIAPVMGFLFYNHLIS